MHKINGKYNDGKWREKKVLSKLMSGVFGELSMWALFDLDTKKSVLIPLKVLRDRVHTILTSIERERELNVKLHRSIIWNCRENETSEEKKNVLPKALKKLYSPFKSQYARRHMFQFVCSVSTANYQSNNSFPWNGTENLSNQLIETKKKPEKTWKKTTTVSLWTMMSMCVCVNTRTLADI